MSVDLASRRPLYGFRQFRVIRGKLPVLVPEVVTHGGGRRCGGGHYVGEVSHASLAETSARRGPGAVEAEEVRHTERGPLAPPAVAEGSLLRGHEAAARAHELAYGGDLVIAEGVLVGQNQDLVFSEVLQEAVGNNREGSARLNQGLFKQERA